MRPMWPLEPPRGARRRRRGPQESPESDPGGPRQRQDGSKRCPGRREKKNTGTKSGQQGNSLSNNYVNAFGSKPLEAKRFEGVVRNNLV